MNRFGFKRDLTDHQRITVLEVIVEILVAENAAMRKHVHAVNADSAITSRPQKRARPGGMGDKVTPL